MAVYLPPILTNEQFSQAINDSDAIMSFANIGSRDELQWTQIYWFDSNEFPRQDEEDILSAELRIYKSRAENKVGGSGLFKMKVFQLVEGPTSDEQLLDSRTLSYSDEGK